MAFYKLSRQRVLHVLHAPKRVEEGVAPKTVAAMAPASIKSAIGCGGAKKEIWNQEIWVMVEEKKNERIIISAWRYPGVTKPRGEAALAQMRQQYEEYKDANKA